MLFILILFTIVCILSDFLKRKDFISPTLIMAASFFLGEVLILFNFNNWMVKINPLFILSVIVFIMAWNFASCLTIKKKHDNGIMFYKYPNYKGYPEFFFFMLSVLLSISFIWLILGGIHSFINIKQVLNEVYQQKMTTNSGHFIFHQIEKALFSIAYVNYYQIMLRTYVYNRKQSILLVIPIILAMLCMLISTDRNIFMRFGFYMVVLWIIFFKNQRNFSEKLNYANKKIFKRILFLFIILTLSFYALGKVKGYTSNFERMIGIYGGSGLYNFNLYLFDNSSLLTLGKQTFSSVLNVLSHFNLYDSSNIISTNSSELGLGFRIFRADNGYVYASNIYSSLFPFYSDFRFFGVFFFSFFLGLFYNKLYFNLKRGGASWIIYSFIVYPIFYLGIADQFFGRLHLGLVYEFFWLFVIYYLAYSKSINYFFKYKSTK